MSNITKQSNRLSRKARARAKFFGTKKRPRISVQATLTGMFVQFIDDVSRTTLISSRDKGMKGTKMERSVLLGKKIAEEAKKKGISRAVFDRGSKKYHGRIKALADALREAGIIF
jgi:large subunit ribosomal protein L18|tara:strand:- start:149 stop:493 length:345 start_codon:yes stop_codon:yes gene_type:complete